MLSIAVGLGACGGGAVPEPAVTAPAREASPPETPPSRGPSFTAHLPWAERMAQEVTPATNAYASDPTVLAWKGEENAPETSNRSVCASFVYALLMKSYGYTTKDLQRWFGSKGPTPVHFSRAISAGKGFTRITKAAELAPGDILGVVYPEGEDALGHVMVVAAPPAPHPESAPKIEGTTQLAVWIYDSTRSPHGEGDSRTPGRMQGAGKGQIRIYADAVSGEIRGYTWSLGAGSSYYGADTRPLVAGRIDGTVKPADDARHGPP